jgi:hypothetical protein
VPHKKESFVLFFSFFFVDGVNMALNDWLEEAGRTIDTFLDKIVCSSGNGAQMNSNNNNNGNNGKEATDETVLKFVQLFVQHKVRCALFDLK